MFIAVAAAQARTERSIDTLNHFNSTTNKGAKWASFIL